MSIYEDIYIENQKVFLSVKDRIVEKVTSDLRKCGATFIYASTNSAQFVVKRMPDGGDYAEVPFGIIPHIAALFKREKLIVTIERWSSGEYKYIKIMY